MKSRGYYNGWTWKGKGWFNGKKLEGIYNSDRECNEFRFTEPGFLHIRIDIDNRKIDIIYFIKSSVIKYFNWEVFRLETELELLTYKGKYMNDFKRD